MSSLSPSNQLPANNITPTLAERRTANLRSIAEYDSVVLPLYLHLENIDLEAVEAWHIARWQAELVIAARLSVRENKERKPALSILPPADLAQHEMSRTLAFFRQVLIGMSSRELAASFDKRKQLAKQLRDASLALTNTTAWRNSVEWEPSWVLAAMLEPQNRHPSIPPPKPDEVGQLLAKIEHFKRCWHEFHKPADEDINISSSTERVANADTPPFNSTLAPISTKSRPKDHILGPGFTLDDVDRLAHAVGLTNEAGHYHLGPRKLGAVLGFCLALQQAGKLKGALPALTAVIGPRFSTIIRTRKTSTDIAQHYFNLTSEELTRLKKTN